MADVDHVPRIVQTQNNQCLCVPSQSNCQNEDRYSHHNISWNFNPVKERATQRTLFLPERKLHVKDSDEANRD